MYDLSLIIEQAYHLVSQKNYDLARLKFIEAISLGGEQTQLVNDLGVVLYKLGSFDDAFATFQRAAELDGNSVVTANLLDIILLLNSDKQKLKQQFIDCQQLKTTNQQLAVMHEKLSRMRIEDAHQAWFENSAAELHNYAKTLTDEQWLQRVIDSADTRFTDGYMMPGFVDPTIQRNFVGSSGKAALVEGANFVAVILHFMRQFGIQYHPDFRVCDFGSGWGRYTRFMIKYAHPDNIYGMDVNGGMLEKCRKNFGMCNFLKISSLPPSPVHEKFFDLLIAYSVFSHLAPDCADTWIDDFARIMRPGGLVILTTQGRSFIEYCRHIRESGDLSHGWFQCLARSFVDTEQSCADYDSGKYLFSATTEDPYYGEALIPPQYIVDRWTSNFELLNFIDDRTFLPQALIVLRRK